MRPVARATTRNDGEADTDVHDREQPGSTAPQPAMACVSDALTRLRALAHQRAEKLLALRAAHHDACIVAAREADARLEAEERQAAAELATAVSFYERETKRIRAEVEQLLASARAARDQQAADVADQSEADLSALRKSVQEAVWMAETLYDANRDKPRQAYERTRDELSSISRALDRIQQQAAAQLEAWAVPGRAEVRAEFLRSSSAAPEPGERDDARAALGEAAAALRELCGLRTPRFFAPPTPYVLVGLIAALASAIGLALAGGRPTAMLAVWAMGGSALSAAGLLWLGTSARRSMESAAVNLAEAIRAARDACLVALKRAGAERQRLEREMLETRDRDVREARTRGAATEREVLERRDAELASIEARWAEARQAAAAHEPALAGLGEERDARRAAAESRLARARADAEAARAHGLAAADADREAAWAAFDHAWHLSLYAWMRQVTQLSQEIERSFPEWNGTVWARGDGPGGWFPRTESPRSIPLGELTLDLSRLVADVPEDTLQVLARVDGLKLPAVLDAPQRLSLLIRSPREGRDTAIRTLQATMLRILTAFPPGKARFLILDPVGLGQNFSAFLHLADYAPMLVHDRIWTEPRHIEEQLTNLAEHLEQVIQKYLRNQFESIEEYNRVAGEVAEPYRFLVIADFPTHFSEQAVLRLKSILNSGPRCGVHTLILADARAPLPAGLELADLQRGAVELVWRDHRLAHAEPPLSDMPLLLESPPDEARFNAIVHLVGRYAQDAGQVRVPFEIVAPPPEAFWSRDAASDVQIPLGRAGAARIQSFILGRGTAQHALIAGRTGAGKSTLLHALVTSAALWYAPEEIELYLVDFKKGVEFKCYASGRLPHVRVVAIESEREFGLSVLRRLDEELRRRGELYRSLGVQDLRGYRASGALEPLPRVLLIVDEFQELFTEDDRLAQEAALLLDRLVRQGRAFGMHVVLGSQTLAGAYSLPRTTMGQMAVRVALACSESDAPIILGDDNAAARLLSRPGEAIYNDAGGAVEGNSPFQVAWLPDDQRERWLDRVAQRAATLPHRNGRPIVFEGNAPAALSACAPLLAAKRTRNGPGGATLEFAAHDAEPRARVRETRLWLGEPVAIKEPTAAVLRRQAGANLLVIGQNEEAALAETVASLMSIVAQHGGERGGRALLLDGIPVDAPHAGMLARFAGLLGESVRSVGYREVEEAMSELNAELDARLAQDRTDLPPIFLVVHGLQRFRMLRRSEDEFDFSSSAESRGASPAAVLVRLLREGPPLGMHVVAWCDTAANLQRTLERGAIREFDWRVLFQMSAADSTLLIDTPQAGLLGPHRALLSSEEQGLVEKFRPWGLVDEEFVRSFASADTGAGAPTASAAGAA